MSRQKPQKRSEFREGDDPRILWSPDLFLAYGLRPWEMEQFTVGELAALFEAMDELAKQQQRQKRG